MDDLKARHERLLESHHGALCQAAERLLAETAWSLATTALLLQAAGQDRSQVVAVGDLGRWIEHLGPDLDAFVRLRRRGVDVGEAYARCRALEGRLSWAPGRAWRVSGPWSATTTSTSSPCCHSRGLRDHPETCWWW